MDADERGSIRLARERLRLDTGTAERRQSAEASLRGMLRQGKVTRMPYTSPVHLR